MNTLTLSSDEFLKQVLITFKVYHTESGQWINNKTEKSYQCFSLKNLAVSF